MKSLNNLTQDKGFRFGTLFVVLFCLFYGFNQFYIGITSPGNTYSPWLDANLNYIRWFRHLLLGISSWLLQTAGYDAVKGDMVLHVKGHGGIILVYSCLGFGVMSFFSAFVLAWPKSLKQKAWFLPFGLLVIQLLNICRFMLIALSGNKKVSALPIDHHDLFNIILYLVLLAMLYCWINYGKQIKIENQPFHL